MMKPLARHFGLFGPIVFLFVLLVGCREGGSGKRRSADGDGAVAGNEVSRPEASRSEASGPVAYDVYIDNSASMDGYMSGPGTDFKNNVHTLLKDLRTQGIADTIDLGYVNARVCPYRRDASPMDVDSYIRTLNHDSLARNACGRTDSYIDAMIQRVLEANPDAVHVLISDYIFSIGRGATTQLLTQQGDNVETVIYNELRKRDLNTVIVKFSSGFDGDYYVEARGGGHNSKVPVKDIRRPYYVMIFGNAAKLRRLMDFFKTSRLRGYSGFEQIAYLMQPGVYPPAAKLIRKERIGEFEIAEPATRLVIDKAAADSGDFQFAVAVNLDGVKLDESYLRNPANYELPANYKLVQIRKVDDPTDQSLQGFTHVFVIRTNDLKAVQDVYVRLKSKLPGWVYTGSTNDDANPTDTLQQKQTFGFEYLVEGMARGYADRYKNMNVFGLNIQVSQVGESGAAAEGGRKGGGFPWALVVILVVIVGLVVWLKNKR
jgi:hypothetical protein